MGRQFILLGTHEAPIVGVGLVVWFKRDDGDIFLQGGRRGRRAVFFVRQGDGNIAIVARR